MKNNLAMMFMLIPSHRVAAWILGWIDATLEAMGLEKGSAIEEIVYTCIVIAIALIVGWVVRWLFVFVAKKTSFLRRFEFGRELINRKVLFRCSHIIPPLLFLALIPFAFESDGKTLDIINRIAVAYLLIALGVAICAILGFVWARFDGHHNNRNLPLRGVLNVGRGIVWIIVAIVTVSVLINKSPTVLLTGLGAFAAALMLIFKDSILGFVAGIQISQNDMLRVGDWVVVPSTIANGVVVDVTLSVVKIRNWDNTIVMLPPYSLVSTSFQNWRGMNDAGVRQISRAVLIDNSSIKKLTPAMRDEIENKIPELGSVTDDDTNLGLFRRYVTLYLKQHLMVSDNHIVMVRLMAGDAYGTPMQIYCFASTTEWAEYEDIQSKIVEHVIAACPTFYLSVSDCNMMTVT